MAIISVAVSFGQRLLCSRQQQLQRFVTVKVRKVSHSWMLLWSEYKYPPCAHV